jgi:hypothetical protein
VGDAFNHRIFLATSHVLALHILYINEFLSEYTSLFQDAAGKCESPKGEVGSEKGNAKKEMDWITRSSFVFPVRIQIEALTACVHSSEMKDM